MRTLYTSSEWSSSSSRQQQTRRNDHMNSFAASKIVNFETVREQCAQRASLNARRWIVVILGALLLVLSPHDLHAQVGNDNPTGPSGIFNGQAGGCGYDPYTANGTIITIGFWKIPLLVRLIPLATQSSFPMGGLKPSSKSIGIPLVIVSDGVTRVRQPECASVLCQWT